ncbi:bifunctional (p)ppGpp synthetase/guanosine-3',5'-bis(diphosphate) 3'-pyrophosphohydrolase [Candidatus Uhrbacteria bacterium]|nr:bifunctional (p)ppGpp synthetase/guanosine-3',5'-bis(diphosphate) 3'-pyrophosphohydrolase [Candidatus Uhrbacteria bacterium]
MPDSTHTFKQLENFVQKNYTNPDLDLLRRANQTAVAAHEGKTRLTGEPFINHPIAVAYRLAEMGLHLNVVVAGLLHDVVEDSEYEIEDVRIEFGDDIASLVDSVTKLKRNVNYRGVERYAENLRKMFLAMASDVRVVFMKFADRLHNLQTLYGQPKHKQERIARESLEIYAPIAGRLGMSEIKGELEDYAFAYLQPKEYERMKSIMDIKDSDDLDKIYDLIAVRIVVNNVEDCYAALGVLHQKWRPVPGRIKDYIAQPKPNGYQSLHTTMFTSEGEVVEFQIRTQEMHELSEYGVAAHWRYKEGSGQQERNMRWMEELAQIQKELASKKDFLEQLEYMKIDVFNDRIFVFTPQGDVIDLPEGATPIDFAYAIHSKVGDKCVAARINDVMRNLDTKLTSGDIIEIVTDKNRKAPNPDWLKFARTRHARKKIRDATRNTVKGWFVGVLHGREKGGK